MRFGFLIAAVLIIGGIIFWKDISGIVKSASTDKNEMKKEDGSEYAAKSSADVIIREKWDLPGELKEVSGIVYLDNNRFACIQDETGTVYIYNRSSNKIEKEIPFAGAGDFEGITMKEQTLFVVRADGQLYEVPMDGKGTVKTYETPLTAEHNIEGLCYDKNGDRLLLAIKGNEPGNRNYKGIYAFELASKKMTTEPVIKIDLGHQLLQSTGKKKKTIMPSAIGLHPVTNELFVVDGPGSKLLIMDADGTMKRLVVLGKDFAQPEGISFSPDGKIFISNEGTKQPGNILKVQI